MAQDFIPVREIDRAARSILNRPQLGDLYVGVAPRAERSGKADAVPRVCGSFGPTATARRRSSGYAPSHGSRRW
jgi:hypothetical protein